MAYRFNPPPNWPVDEPGWTPPPGWQPDPSWGPAPDGWNFWVEDAAEPSASAGQPAQDEASAPADSPAQTDPTEQADPTQQTDSPEQVAAPAAEGDAALAAGADDDETRMVSTQDDLPAAAPTGDAEQDETRVVDSAERDAAEDVAGDPAAGATEDAPSAPSFGSEPQAAADAPETEEFPGRDLDSDLKTAAPYESAAPVDQQTPAPSYGSSPAVDSGQAPAYGSADQPGYAADGYGQSPSSYPSADGYGSANSYGTGDYPQAASPAAFGSPAEQGSWQAAPAGGGPAKPQKGLLARFWWVGCILLAILALILGLIGFAAVKAMGGKDDPSPSASGTTTTAPTTTDPATTDPATTDPATTDPATTPVAQPTIDPAAVAQPVQSSQGKGTVAVEMKWQTADQLPSEYGGTISPGTNPEYLVVVAKVTTDEGELNTNPFNFAVVTPYGGAVDPATETFGLKDSGIGIGDDSVTAGNEQTIMMVFDIAKNPGLKVQYDTYDNQYSWDVPV